MEEFFWDLENSKFINSANIQSCYQFHCFFKERKLMLHFSHSSLKYHSYKLRIRHSSPFSSYLANLNRVLTGKGIFSDGMPSVNFGLQ
jgi:hypothetical protein